MGVTLRPGREEDLPVIEAVALREQLDSREPRPEQFVVAENDGMLIGFGRLLDHPDSWEIACLYVEPGRRRKRIGSAIVEALLARTSQEKPVYAVAAQPDFFAALGFVNTKTRPSAIAAKHDYCRRHFDDVVVIMRLER
ncbi:MAG TPA: GNAT family N-acetyltransferase [Armatimonadota bacterium]|jgi:N-acetylglutamate synthase-like GNAT family acetyltransferase